MLGFGIGALVIGVVEILMHRTWSAIAGDRLNRFPGLRAPERHWRTRTIVIGCAWLIAGGIALSVALLSPR